ncbi:hypothetical protein BIY31_00260 [Gibbsiella quercinecans]|nr:hypothetical protein BIY31_00260 [Gibbsiella quercinecans]
MAPPGEDSPDGEPPAMNFAQMTAKERRLLLRQVRGDAPEKRPKLKTRQHDAGERQALPVRRRTKPDAFTRFEQLRARVTGPQTEMEALLRSHAKKTKKVRERIRMELMAVSVENPSAADVERLELGKTVKVSNVVYRADSNGYLHGRRETHRSQS